MNHDTMQAGEEMDAAVAEAIGWKDWQPINGLRGFPVAIETMHDQWEPSTNIAHAWEVVEALTTGDLGRATFDVRKDGLSTYAVSFGLGKYATADTAPLAICRAALKAVGK